MLTRLLKVFLTIALTASLAGGSVATFSALLWGDSVDYARVASIKDAREYQDPVLLEKAWTLPVAALYHSDIEFQRNSRQHIHVALDDQQCALHTVD